MDQYFELSKKNQLFYLELSIISFRNYFKLIERDLEEHLNLRSEIYSKAIRELQEDIYPNEEHGKVFHDVSSSLDEIKIEFIQRFRYSMIIQLYSFLENELIDYCQNVYEHANTQFQISDLKGNGELEKAKLFLLNTTNINLAPTNDWKFINNFRKIRNCIVHANGQMTLRYKDFHAIQEFAKQNFHMKLLGGIYFIRIDDPKFIEESLVVIERFLSFASGSSASPNRR